MQNRLRLDLKADYCFDNADVMLLDSSILMARPEHCHTFYEYFLVESGNAIHTVNERSYVIEKGDLVFIRPNDTHIYNLYETRDFHVINVPLTAADINRAIEFLHLNADNLLYAESVPNSRLDVGKAAWIAQRLHSIANMPVSALRGAQLRAATAEIILALLQPNDELKELPQWMKETIQLLERNIDTPEKFDVILANCGRSAEHVCRTFKRYFRIAPEKYCGIMRIRRAGELLQTTDLSIQEISQKGGYSRPSYFSKCFAEYYHMTPSEYRRRTKKNQVE